MQKPKIFNWSLIAIIALGLFVGVLLFTNHSSGFLLRQERAKVKELQGEIDALLLKAASSRKDSQESETEAKEAIEKIKYIRTHETKLIANVAYLSDDSLLLELQRSLTDVNSHRRPDRLLFLPNTSE
jgi:hypothetical protein